MSRTPGIGEVPNDLMKQSDDIGGTLNGRSAEKTKNQPSKGWFILAIAIGIVVFGAGGFGTVGLLHAHGMIGLPPSFEWLASAIGTVGSNPHSWSLWAMAIGGIVVGGGLIASGSYKFHKAKQQHEKEFEQLQPKSSLEEEDLWLIPEEITILRIDQEKFENWSKENKNAWQGPSHWNISKDDCFITKIKTKKRPHALSTGGIHDPELNKRLKYQEKESLLQQERREEARGLPKITIEKDQLEVAISAARNKAIDKRLKYQNKLSFLRQEREREAQQDLSMRKFS